MKKYKVLYIDDENSENSKTFADGLSKNGSIEITIIKPTNLEKLVAEIVAKQANIDALILDLKLDGNQKGDRTAKFTAPTLATGIKTKYFSENGIETAFPIFLISSIANLKKYYDPDTSSHDLFDFTIPKGSIGKNGDYYESIIHSITNAYIEIQKEKTNFNHLLALSIDNEIPNKIFTSKYLSGKETSISEISQYIFNEVIYKSGVLIDEYILAARLGVDFENSDDWDNLKAKIEEFKYTGIFSTSFDRWWAYDVINWWNSNFNKSLIQLTASERVKLIKEKFDLTELKEAQPIAKTTSTKFWTICQVYKKPLDPKDGFLVDGNLLNWQDKKYISLESILERDAKKEGVLLNPAERERFEDIKSEYK
ncbi:hypothetical protein SAMN04488009_2261 [Maribacter sedimenticola]|uniref:Response regulator receiver domain-containing protein n=1 Tax=Maribacter sedimenticola TaxID=228956 RepID=A0ABY1SHJ6_9FLAO|nr:hypothetical protein [Maribacter sedimenticola]SNR54167.1 hypothetical protein SAMN04488009_2261 [Maribacter sedimenticola]